MSFLPTHATTNSYTSGSSLSCAHIRSRIHSKSINSQIHIHSHILAEYYVFISMHINIPIHSYNKHNFTNTWKCVLKLKHVYSLILIHSEASLTFAHVLTDSLTQYCHTLTCNHLLVCWNTQKSNKLDTHSHTITSWHTHIHTWCHITQTICQVRYTKPPVHCQASGSLRSCLLSNALL